MSVKITMSEINLIIEGLNHLEQGIKKLDVVESDLNTGEAIREVEVIFDMLSEKIDLLIDDTCYKEPSKIYWEINPSISDHPLENVVLFFTGVREKKEAKT